MFAKRTLTAIIFGCAVLGGPAAYAGDTTPAAPAAPPSPAAAPAVPAPPSPAAIAAADQLLIDMGVKETIAKTVPAMMPSSRRTSRRRTPRFATASGQTLTAIKPEFDKSAQNTYAKVEALLALALSEKEIEDVAAFFESPTGKKYLALQPVFFQKLQDVLGPWQQSLSTDIVTRAREEMKKKGVDVLGRRGNGLRRRLLRHRRGLRRRSGGAHCRRTWRKDDRCRGEPDRRDLRHSRLRPEEALRLRQPLRRRVRGRRRVRLERRRNHLRLAEPGRGQGEGDFSAFGRLSRQSQGVRRGADRGAGDDRRARSGCGSQADANSPRGMCWLRRARGRRSRPASKGSSTRSPPTRPSTSRSSRSGSW